MKLLDLNHTFFKPVGVRVAVVAVCFFWGLFEFANGSGLWGVFFVGLAVICGYRFAVIDYAAMTDADNSPRQGD